MSYDCYELHKKSTKVDTFFYDIKRIIEVETSKLITFYGSQKKYVYNKNFLMRWFSFNTCYKFEAFREMLKFRDDKELDYIIKHQAEIIQNYKKIFEIIETEEDITVRYKELFDTLIQMPDGILNDIMKGCEG